VQNNFPFIHLEGHAKIWYDTIPDSKKSHYDQFIAAFKERFTDKQHLLDLTILQTHQRRNESILDYLSMSLKLAINRNISDDILLAVAMNGLKAGLKTIVVTKELKNIEEFRHSAILAEKEINSNIGTISSMNQTVLDEIQSLKDHIKSTNVINEPFQPIENQLSNSFNVQQPYPNSVLVQQPAYYAPPVQNQRIYPSRYFRPRSQNFRPRMSNTAPRQQFNRNVRQPISFPRQTSVRTCPYCNGFCQTRAQCPASDVVIFVTD
jgi:hypothetical protein